MILKILKEYLRRISRNYKIYAISILGMSIAIIASFHIYHFVFKELSVDTSHTKRKDIYRLVNKNPNSNFRSTETFLPLGELLKGELPEVQDYVRIITEFPLELIHEGKTGINNFLLIDPSFFKIFDFRLKSGSVENFKNTPNGIIISEKTATQLFKNENPIGKTITVSRYRSNKNNALQVVGVMEGIPKTSTIYGDYFINISCFYDFQRPNSRTFEWFARDAELYVYAPKLSEKEVLSNKITTALLPKIKSPNNLTVMSVGLEDIKEINYQFDLQRLDELYFDSLDISGQKIKGDIQFIRVLILIICLALFLATSNYIIMNLGLNLNRAKEFKTKRYLGASKKNIFFQFLTESTINTAFCFVLTLISYPLLDKFISNIIGFDYHLSLTNDFTFLISFFLIILSIGVLIGVLEYLLSYKSIFITNKEVQPKNTWLSKKIMIVFQLFLFICLTICILFVRKQIDYIHTKDIGYDIKNVISVSSNVKKDLKNYLKTKSYVKEVSRGQSLFKTKINLEKVFLENKEVINTIQIEGDENYLKVHGIRLLKGKGLNSSNTPTKSIMNTTNHYVKFYDVLVNEEFVKRANLKNPIGTILTKGEIKKYTIVGVFQNVYNSPLYNPVQPIIIGSETRFAHVFQVACEESYKAELISDLINSEELQQIPEKYREQMVGTYNYQDIYKKELILKRLLEAFTFIVLFISILGMIAISLFITESKTKEIGIRKVNGATIKEIMLMLNKDFIKWVVVAFVIACPIAYYAMSKWLENFAYKTTLSWWVFALAGVFTLVIALLTVSWQTYRAATRNPVESLRDE